MHAGRSDLIWKIKEDKSCAKTTLGNIESFLEQSMQSINLSIWALVVQI